MSRRIRDPAMGDKLKAEPGEIGEADPARDGKRKRRNAWRLGLIHGAILPSRHLPSA